MGLAALLAAPLAFAAAAPAGPSARGRVETLHGFRVLCVAGSPEQMGEQHGRLLKPLVRRVVKTIVRGTYGDTPEGYRSLLDGARVMERYLPDAFRRELRALARAAGVKYDELVALQLFGDVNRGRYAMDCSTYAALGPATRTGECIVGRNMDYWDYGVMDYAAVLIHFQPDDGIPFVTVSWAGVINGWTAMNVKGVCVANNTAYGARSNSLHGLSTCFMLRKIAQYCSSVDEGVETIRSTRRACGTVMLVAGGSPPKAAEVEYDHDAAAVRWATKGYVAATNHFRTLYQDPPLRDDEGWSGRYQRLIELLRKNYGRIDETQCFVADPQVYMDITLHSALLLPARLRFRLAMGRRPAPAGPYHAFRLTRTGLVAEPAAPGLRRPAAPQAP